MDWKEWIVNAFFMFFMFGFILGVAITAAFFISWKIGVVLVGILTLLSFGFWFGREW